MLSEDDDRQLDDFLAPPPPLDWRVPGWRWPFVFSLLAHGLLAGWFAFAAGKRQALPSEPSPEGWSAVEQRGLDVRFIDILDGPEAPTERVVTVATSIEPRTPKPAAPIIEPTPHDSDVKSTQPAQSPSAVVGTGASPGPLGTAAGSANGAGPESKLFPVPAEARSVVYVLDSSGSMGQQGRLFLAEQEVVRSVGRLSAAVRFQIIAYNRQMKFLVGSGGLQSADRDRLTEIKGRLNQLVPEGGTDHFQALRQAVLLRPEVIFFLTDADDLKPEDVRALTQLNQGKSAIHVVELNLANRDRVDLPMHRLARENRGKYLAVDASR
jgi:hypothetical protein